MLSLFRKAQTRHMFCRGTDGLRLLHFHCTSPRCGSKKLSPMVSPSQKGVVVLHPGMVGLCSLSHPSPSKQPQASGGAKEIRPYRGR